jgi:hypothetical protein
VDEPRTVLSQKQTNLKEALRAAGLDTAVALRVEATQQYCDRVALLIARGYMEGRVSWSTADSAINHLWFVMLACPSVPARAEAIYDAFESGEYHPASPELSEDDVTRSMLLIALGDQ